MTPDEMDKNIEFILQMQAQFAANLGRSEANIDNLRVSVADLAGVVRESVKLSDDRFTRLADRLTYLAEAQAATGKIVKELAESQKELAASQKTTDDRLNALIYVVERHITGPDHTARP
jgi:hypothetical protein